VYLAAPMLQILPPNRFEIYHKQSNILNSVGGVSY